MTFDWENAAYDLGIEETRLLDLVNDVAAALDVLEHYLKWELE